MAGRLNRFLNLEGARPIAQANSLLNRSVDNGSVDNPAVEDELRERRAAQLQSGLAIDERSDEEQPFIRCGQCGTDSARLTVRCGTCAADLDTPLQRSFNQSLWQRLRSEASSNLEAVAPASSAPLASADPLAGSNQPQLVSQRELGESLARQVRNSELGRLDWMHDPGESARSQPLPFRLLMHIPSARWRTAAAMSMIALAAVAGWQAFRLARHHPLWLLPIAFLAWRFFSQRRPDNQ